MGENEKSSAATVFGVPQSLISLKSIEKALQIKDFVKRNWTPIKIRIVSKLVSSYGRGAKTRTLDTRFWRPLLYQLSYTPMKNLRLRKPIAVYHILSEKARAFFKKVKIFV